MSVDERSRAAGRAALATAGVPEDATAPDVLLPLAGRGPDLDLAIVERLARAPSEESARALRTLATTAEERGWKAVAKDARRALYRFTQRGVAVPPPAAPRAVPRPPSVAIEGHLSPIDGRGDRLVWLARPRPEGGLLVMTGVLNEPDGLKDVALAEMPRKAFRRMGHDLHERHGLRMVVADGLYCDALLAEGYRRARAANTPGVGEYPTLRARLLTAEPAALEPPLIDRVAAPAAPGETPGTAALLDQPEFATWILDRKVLAPYLAEIAEARESPLLLSPAQREERVRGIVTRALHEIFTGATAAAYRRRLEEMAYYLLGSGRPGLARAARTAARTVAESGRGGEGVAILEEITRRSFAAYAAEDSARARAEAESSLIVRPSAAPPPGPRGR